MFMYSIGGHAIAVSWEVSMFDKQRLPTDPLESEVEDKPILLDASANFSLGFTERLFECEPIVAGPGKCTQCDCPSFVYHGNDTQCYRNGCNHEYLYHSD